MVPGSPFTDHFTGREAATVATTVIAAMIWITYFLYSERVEETFVFTGFMSDVIRSPVPATVPTTLPDDDLSYVAGFSEN